MICEIFGHVWFTYLFLVVPTDPIEEHLDLGGDDEEEDDDDDAAADSANASEAPEVAAEASKSSLLIVSICWEFAPFFNFHLVPFDVNSLLTLLILQSRRLLLRRTRASRSTLCSSATSTLANPPLVATSCL